MNLKYYLRGLGIGIIVTALIMGIASNGKKESLSNEEIKERARELGMTEESTVLADTVAREPAEDEASKEPASIVEPIAPEKTREPEPAAAASPSSEAVKTPESIATEKPAPEETKKPAAAVSPMKTQEPSAAPTLSPMPKASAKPTATPSPSAAPSPSGKPDAEPEDADKITIQINSGDSSYSVCEQLEEAGLVESASGFDRYLCENDYDKRINFGTFKIPAGADHEQIAKILARMD